jgi:RND superfamily putative drug exporter
MLERWTRGVVRFRGAVILCWLAILVAGAWTSTRLPDLLSNSFDVPGTDSDRARTLLAQHFGERPDGAFIVVFPVRHPSDRALQDRLRRRVERAATAVPTAHVGIVGTGGRIVFVEVDTTLDLQQAKRHTPALRRALDRQRGPRGLVTGQPAIQHDLDPVFASDLRLGEAIAVPAALAVLVAVLGFSLAVLVPFVVAACTIAATLIVVYALAHELSMVTYVTNLVELIGLGLAIDYSLLVVHRFREEVARGAATDDAIARTAATAGRAVVASGLAVAAGLGLLLLMPVPLLRSMGVGGLLIPLASIAAALTLQPALLSLLGHRASRAREPDVEHGFWARHARSIMRRPILYFAAGATVLVCLALPLVTLELTPGSFSDLPRSPEAMRGFALLRDGVGRGAVTPTHIVVDAGARGRARAQPTQAAIERLADELVRDPEALVVATGHRRRYLDPSGRYARLIVAGRHEYGAGESRRFVRRLRDRLAPRARFPRGVDVYAGGAPPQGVDFVDRSYGAFPWLVAGVLVLTFVVLLRAFRSLVLPLEALLLNVLSVAAVYGVLALAFDHVEAWIPVFLFAALFGISMDYQVFLVTRMREAWDRVYDNRRAVAHGLEHTGRIVTAAAAIMIAAFSGFIVGQIEALRQFGIGLALAVLIDATLVRMILVPALMAVVGRWNWWLPERAARLARVEPSPLREHRGRLNA